MKIIVFYLRWEWTLQFTWISIFFFIAEQWNLNTIETQLLPWTEGIKQLVGIRILETPPLPYLTNFQGHIITIITTNANSKLVFVSNGSNRVHDICDVCQSSYLGFLMHTRVDLLGLSLPPSFSETLSSRFKLRNLFCSSFVFSHVASSFGSFFH